MRILTSILLFLCILPISAAEEAAGSSGVWQTVVGGLLALIPIALVALSGWVRKKLGIERDEPLDPITSDLTLQEAKARFLARLKAELVEAFEEWVLANSPNILIDATDGDGFQWAEHWDSLRTYLLKEGRAFLQQNQDAVTYIGQSQELDKIVDKWLIKQVTRLPESVRQFLPDEVVDQMTDKARAFLREKGLSLLPT